MSLWYDGYSMIAKREKSERKRLPTQAEAARLLGVTREHLNCVLNKRRQSIPLLARYYNLLAAHKADRSRTTKSPDNEVISNQAAPALPAAKSPT